MSTLTIHTDIAQLQSTILSINPFQTDSFDSEVQWVRRWVIKASAGNTAVIIQLLRDIEEILGANPTLTFLRIVEEKQDGELFIRVLRIFIETETITGAQEDALSYACANARKRSQQTCFICGDTINIQKWDKDDEEIDSSLTTFIKLFDDSEFNNNFFYTCTNCICCSSDSQQKSSKTTNANSHKADKTIHHIKSIKLKKTIKTIRKSDGSHAYQYKTNTDTEKNSDCNSQNTRQSLTPQIPIFKMSDVDKMELAYEGATKDQSHRVKALAKRMRAVAPDKKLVTITDDWKPYCEQLMRNFPNFTEVITFIRNQLALASLNDNQVLHIPSFLLLGEAGVGKTEFLLTLTQHFNSHLEIIDVASLQSGSTLSGSENFWGNTKPSLLFNSLVFGESANPFILLDEIDKASNDKTYPPLSALHQLLEPRQAQAYKDLSVPEIKLDASRIIWAATANHIESIEKPIADRFTIFTIEKPDNIQMQVIIKNLYQQIIQKKNWGAIFNNTINTSVVMELSRHHPRKVRKLLEQSFGHAAFNQRNYLTVEDVQACLINETQKITIGFIN